MKLARRATGRTHIIAFSGAFHGRTYGATSLTSSSLNYRIGLRPAGAGRPHRAVPQRLSRLRWRRGTCQRRLCLALPRAALRASRSSPARTAAFIIEPVQGEGGYVPAPVAFLQGLRELATRHGILLIMDEVQSGYGRTGKMWAFEHADIVPDVVLAAKAIANGMPLAALVSPRELQERWGLGAHGSTYGGNPVSCAAGIAVLEVMREGGPGGQCRRARRRADAPASRRWRPRIPRIGDVRGPGLMIGVEMVKDPARAGRRAWAAP